MKIAIVCFNIDWPAGGPRLLYSFAKEVKKMGHEVSIYVPHFSGQYFKELWTGLDIRVVKPREEFVWEGRPSFFKWIARKIKQEELHLDTARRIANALPADLDLLNVHDYAYRVAYFYRKRNPKAKILWNSNDPPYSYLPKKNPAKAILSKLYNWYRDIASKEYFLAIDSIVVLDKFNQDWCAARGLQSEIVYLGVDFENFYLPVKNFAEKARQKKVQIMGLGALNKYRRYDDTILAVKQLRDWGYDATALIICNDTWHETEYRNFLVHLVRENNLEHFVRLKFEGANEAKLKDAFKESDVFVYAVYLPPPRDGFGFSIAVMEAIASGLPLIMCRTTTSMEVLHDGETALFVDPMSPTQIAEKIKMLVDDPKLYDRIARTGQELVKKEFSWENYAKKILDIATSH